MPIQAVNELASWLSGDPPRQINLIGGEPFLRDDLPEIVAIFRQKCPKSQLTIFTGGIISGQSLSQLSPDDLSGILVNVNEERDYPNRHIYDKVIGFIETAIAMGFRITLGYNIWRLDFDTEFMPHIAYSLGRQGFRWSVANPSLMGGNKVVSPSDFRELSKIVIQMLYKSVERGLTTHLDCPLPSCFFKNEDLAWIARYQPNVVTNIGTCSAPIDITPELEAIRCFSISSFARTPINQHASLAALTKWFTENEDRDLLARKGIFEECLKCDHFLAGRCHGGCLGWRDLRQPGNAPTAKHFYDLLQAGNYAQVIEELESASQWFLTPLLLYLGVLAAYKLGELDKAKRFLCVAHDHVTNLNLQQKLRRLLKQSFR